MGQHRCLSFLVLPRLAVEFDVVLHDYTNGCTVPPKEYQQADTSGRRHILMTISEAAEELRISAMSMYRLIHEGIVQTVDVGTGKRSRTRVSREAIEKMIEARSSHRSPRLR